MLKLKIVVSVFLYNNFFTLTETLFTAMLLL